MTAWVLCLNPSTARLRTNDDKLPLSDVTDAWHLPAFDDEVTNDGKEVIREPSRDDSVADEFKHLMLEKKWGNLPASKDEYGNGYPVRVDLKKLPLAGNTVVLLVIELYQNMASKNFSPYILTFQAAIIFTSLTVSAHQAICKFGTCYFLPLIFSIPDLLLIMITAS